MNFAESIPILIPRELPHRMAHRAMAVAPSRQPAIDIVLICVYRRALGDRPSDQGGDRRLLDVRQHPDDDLARALDHPEDRRLFLRQRPTATLPLQPPPSSRPPLFLDRLWMTLMSCRDIDFIAFHLAAERHRRLASHDALAQLRGHPLNVITVEIQLLSDLFLREIQPHEVEAEDPRPQGPVMAGEDRAGQVIEAPPTGRALVPLPRRLGLVASLLGDSGGSAMRAGHSVGPAHLPDGLEASAIVDEVPDVQHHPCTHGVGERKTDPPSHWGGPKGIVDVGRTTP